MRRTQEYLEARSEGRKHITKEPNGRAEKRSKRTKASDGATKGDNAQKREDNDDKNRKKGRNDNDNDT